MATKYAGIHLPGGCEVSVGDDVGSLVDVGVIPMETESAIQVSYDTSLVQGSKREEVIRTIRNLKAEATTELYQFKLDVINRLAGGVMNVNAVAGSPVTGATQTIAAGWTLSKLYLLDNQNADGSKVMITTVKSGTKTLVAGTDYIEGADASGRWGIMIIDATNAPTTTAVVITYGYTPAASVHATMGSSSITISPKIVRFKKVVEGKLFQVTLWSATMTNGIKFTFAGADSEKPAVLPVTITGSLDSSRAQGEQLLDIIDEIGVA